MTKPLLFVSSDAQIFSRFSKKRLVKSLLSTLPLSVLPMTAIAATNSTNATLPYYSQAEQTQTAFKQLFDQDGDAEQLLDKAHVDETLTALRLKQAVEAGIIEAKVLEDYRKNTLKSLQSQAGGREIERHTDSQKITADNINTNQQGQIVSPNLSNLSQLSNSPNLPNIESDLELPNGLAQANDWQNLQQAAQQAQAGQYQMQSPQELEQYAQQVAAYAQTLNQSIDNKVDLDADNGFDGVSAAQLDSASPNMTTMTMADTTITPEKVTATVEQNQQQVQAVLGQGGSLLASQSSGLEPVATAEPPAPPAPAKKADQSANVFKRLYANLFSDGYLPLPRLDANIYLKIPAADGNPDNDRLVKVDTDSQPAKNIKASLEDLFVESVSDFKAALPKIRETAKHAAEAVGYYDVQMQFVQTDSDSIDVIINSVGEPVIVDKRVVEVRNFEDDSDGDNGSSGKEALIAMQDYLPPLQGEVFNHGVYEASKQAIAQMGARFGYFDASWLSQSVDIVLPDNTADIALLYNAGTQYDFGNVVFFTYDKDSKQLTTDPDKLPLKPELLQKLLNFNTGDNYYAPAVTKFSNDLSATRYFNTVNVETVLPERGVQSEIVSDTTTSSQQAVQANADEMLNTNDVDNPDNLNNLNNLDNLENAAPIEFTIDDDIANKLAAIEQKAQRLYSQPDDRVLVEESKQSTTLLGKLSNEISDIATKLDPLASDTPAQELERPELQGKLTPQQVYDSKQVPIYVYVQSDKPRDAEVGLGYGTDSGVRVTGRLDYNLINRDGYQAGIQTSLSRINKNVSVYASRPWKHPLNDTVKANLKYEEELIDQGFGTFNLQSQSILAGLARNIIRESGWNRTYSVRYRYDELSSKVDASFYRNLPIRFAAGDDTQQALLFGYGMSKTEADDVANPNFGFRQYYSIEGGVKSLLTDTDMIIARAGVTGVHSFGEGLKHQVIGSLDGGYIWADKFFEVPYKLRFFAGGDQSIRGYDYNSLSPLEFDYLYGGQALAVGSLEYNYEFMPGFRGAVFTDFGNAYDADFKNETKVGAGFGIRWASPVGPVRVDLAAGVSEDDPPIRLHFFIGSPLR